MGRRTVFLAFAAAVSLAAACSSEPAEVVRARAILAEDALADPNVHGFALKALEHSDAPHAKAFRLDAIARGSRAVAGAAIHAVGESPDAEAMGALRQAFAGSGSVKLAAAAELAKSGDLQAIEWLAGQLEQTGYILSKPVNVALAETVHEEAVRESLARLVENDDVSIRNEGYAILGAIHKPWAVTMLKQGLEREFGEERSGPIAALGESGDPSAATVIRDWVGIQGLVLASLQALGDLGDPEAMQQVGAMLGHEQPLVRIYAAAAAVKLGAVDQAAEVVAGLIADPDPEVRAELAVQLASVDGEAASGWLLEMTSDDVASVRAEAFRGLIGRQGAGLAEAFAAGAQDPAYEVATVALTGLAEAGDPSHVKALVPLLGSNNPYVAVAAAHAVLSLSEDQG